MQLSNEVAYNIGFSADIWAAACIVLEAAVWVVSGRQGLLDFAADRLAEIGPQDSSLRRAGRSDCFHKGSQPLVCVCNVPEYDLDSLSKHMTKVALDVLKEPSPQNRPSAGVFFSHLEKVFFGTTSASSCSLDIPTVSTTSRSSQEQENIGFLHSPGGTRSASNHSLIPSPVQGPRAAPTPTTLMLEDSVCGRDTQLNLDGDSPLRRPIASIIQPIPTAHEILHEERPPETAPSQNNHQAHAALDVLSFEYLKAWYESCKRTPRTMSKPPLPGQQRAFPQLRNRDHVGLPL